VNLPDGLERILPWVILPSRAASRGSRMRSVVVDYGFAFNPAARCRRWRRSRLSEVSPLTRRRRAGRRHHWTAAARTESAGPAPSCSPRDEIACSARGKAPEPCPSPARRRPCVAISLRIQAGAVSRGSFERSRAHQTVTTSGFSFFSVLGERTSRILRATSSVSSAMNGFLCGGES